MPKILNRREAIFYLGLDEKIFDNYFKIAKEFSNLERNGGKGHYLFDAGVLREWKENFLWRKIDLIEDDYVLCLDFALAQHFRGYVLSDFGTSRQREFGQKITNWVKGQLGEVAVKKFLKKEFNIDIELDFNIYDEIVPQDIIGVIENGQRRSPKIDVGIKSSKPKSAFLILGENEIVLKERRSDVYILSRPDIADDHLLRVTRERIIALVKDKPHFASYKDKIPKFTNISCEIAGWCYADELEKREAKQVPGLDNAKGFRYIKQSGLLRKSKKDWQELAKLI